MNWKDLVTFSDLRELEFDSIGVYHVLQCTGISINLPVFFSLAHWLPVPGQPQGIQVQAVNDSCAHVRAQPPMSKNGILTDYRIEVEELESNQNSGQNVNVSFSASRPGMEYIWCGLGKRKFGIRAGSDF